MCQAKVYLERGGKLEMVMEDVIHLRVDGDTIWLTRFFEEPKSVEGTLREADFLKHTVTIEPIST